LETFDIVIIGAGMAGASIAGELSGRARVLLLEREEQPGYHSTGRSAAAFIPSYGCENPSLRLLTNHSLSFLLEPPEIFQISTLLHRRGLLTLCPPGQEAAAQAEFEHVQQAIPGIRRADSDFIRERIPLIRDEYLAAGWYEPDVFDMDVHALHEGYLRTVRHHGGRLVNRANITGLGRTDDMWRVDTPEASYSAPLLVNAAGAWADEVAALAGVNGIGLTPLRRTAVLLDPPAGCDVSGWPLVLASDGSFYLKPDAGLILASPADEHPSQPCDAQPEELDIAYAVHYAQEALQLEVRQVKHSWAGLRNFVADRTPVIGFAPDAEGFFWLAGQGGHGIQTAPAAARLAASLLLDNGIPADLAQAGFDPAWVSPRRLEANAASPIESHPQSNVAQ
jgi:D-arginine dehydrogenase